MPVFLIKSILSVILAIFVIIAMFSMFELLGRQEKKYDPEKLRKLHRLNGRLYIVFFLLISFVCISYMMKTKTELPPRANLHTFLAFSAFLILLLKISFVKIYKAFYGHVKALGIVLSVVSLCAVGSSAGYYLIVTEFGTAEPFIIKSAEIPAKTAIKTDPESISRGKELYDSKCYLCHDPGSHKTINGPGHKEIMKNSFLPVSGRASTADNIAFQLRKPVGKMPSFDYLSDDEIADIIAYMNTL